MFRSCSTRPSSRSVDVVPASIDMALTPISRPEACVTPILARWTLRLRSPSSMPFRPSTAMSVAAESKYSQKAIPYNELAGIARSLDAVSYP